MLVAGYDNEELIARSGFARLYRARQRSFDRDVAIKVLEFVPDDERVRARFARQCAAMGRLTGHPSIVTVLDSGFTDDGRPYLITPFSPRGSLAQQLAERGPLPVDEVLHIGVAMADALDVAHRADILHRDVKPENIVISAFGQPALVDFGLAALAQDESTDGLEITQAITIDHAAPEALDGLPATAAADVYALASSLWALLSGGPPFPARPDEGLVERIRRVQEEPLPPIDRADVPAELERILGEAMAKDPDERPTSAAELGRRFEALMKSHAPSAIDLRGDPVTGLALTGRNGSADAVLEPGTRAPAGGAAFVAPAFAPDPGGTTKVAEDPELGPPSPPPPWRGQMASWDQVEPVSGGGQATSAVPAAATSAVPSAPPAWREAPALEPSPSVGAPRPARPPRRWPTFLVALAVMLVAAGLTAAILSRARSTDGETIEAIDATTTSVPSTTGPPTTPAPAPAPAPAPTTGVAPTTAAPRPAGDAVPAATGQVVVPAGNGPTVVQAGTVAQSALTALAGGNWAQARALLPDLADSTDSQLAESWGNLEHATVVVTDSRGNPDGSVAVRIGVVAHERNEDGTPRTNLYCVTWTTEGGKVTGMGQDQTVGGQPWRAGSWAAPAEGIAILRSSCSPIA